jgi:hypothetical protein
MPFSTHHITNKVTYYWRPISSLGILELKENLVALVILASLRSIFFPVHTKHCLLHQRKVYQTVWIIVQISYSPKNINLFRTKLQKCFSNLELGHQSVISDVQSNTLSGIIWSVWFRSFCCVTELLNTYVHVDDNGTSFKCHLFETELYIKIMLMHLEGAFLQ